MQFSPLSDDERLGFERDGFLIVRNVLDRQTIEPLLAASDRLIASERTLGRQFTEDGRYDGFRNCIALDPVYLPLLTHDQTLPRVLQLMSPNIQLHTSHVIYSGPTQSGDRRNPGWHRDINTLPVQDLGHRAAPRVEIKVAFQLSDASEPGCGQTVVALGSNRLRSTLDLNEDGDPDRVVEPLLAAGDALLFENRTWHAGGHNHSGQTRKVLMLGYSYRWMRPDDYLTQKDDLLHRCDPIERQLLGGTCTLYAEDGRFVPGGTDQPLNDWCAQYGIGSAWEMQPSLLA